MDRKGEREGKTETYETTSKLQQRVGNIERIGTRKLTEGLKHKKMKERSFHTPKGLHKKNLKEMVWRTEQKRNKKKVYTREQRNLRRARTQRRTMETRKTKERSTWPSIPHQNTEQKELRGESRSREGSKWGVRTQVGTPAGSGGENILRQPGSTRVQPKTELIIYHSNLSATLFLTKVFGKMQAT